MRVYVPLTLPGLAEAHRTGELGTGAAYAVTPALRDWYGSEDVEELEYAALNAAGTASLRLLAGDDGAARRRVVVAVDVADGAVTAVPDADEPGEVSVAGPVRLAEAAAVHLDSADAEGAVAAGDADALEDHDLLWYATQEIPNLLADGH
ncbi:hypothetical protein [Streptomyces sp. NPDC003717]|uniref:DUF6912 family protein n=1 Tax=Streptomyces sp. NPDC003717 TaxID=3154276 RepID=UPI0033A32799